MSMTIDRALELAQNALHAQRQAAVDPSPQAIADNEEALTIIDGLRSPDTTLGRLFRISA